MRLFSIMLEWFVKTDFIDATRCLLVVTMYAVTGAAVLKGVDLPEFWTNSFSMVTLFYLGTEAIDQVKKLRSGKSSRDIISTTEREYDSGVRGNENSNPRPLHYSPNMLSQQREVDRDQ